MTSNPTSHSDRVVAPDGTTLRVISRNGDPGAPTFLLVHGLASNARLWDGVGDRLAAAGHSSVAVDQRGHGESAKVDHGYDFATIADDLAAVISVAGGGPVIAVGQSWGGNVVLELAGRRPDLVAGVVCVDGGFITLADMFPDWETAETVLAPPSVEGATLDGLTRVMSEGLVGFSAAAIEAQLANFEELPDGTVRARLSRDRHMTILRHLWEHDPASLAPHVPQPLLLIATEGGPGDKRDRVDAFARRFPQATTVWFDAHHDVHAQHPEDVGDLLVEFAAVVGGSGS